MPIWSVATAVTRGLSSSSVMLSHISLGSVTALVPDTNIATTTSSKDVMNANSAPTSTPTRVSGRVTRQKACQAFAPSIRAARSSRRSKVRITASTLMTT